MLGKLRSLTLEQRRALRAAAPLVLRIRTLLKLRPLPRVLARVRRWAPRVEFPERPVPIAALVWGVRASSRRLVRRNPCLTEALVLWILLRRNGRDGELRIGVAREGESGFDAHAWVECEGEILIGGPESPERYVPLPSFEIGS